MNESELAVAVNRANPAWWALRADRAYYALEDAEKYLEELCVWWKSQVPKEPDLMTGERPGAKQYQQLTMIQARIRQARELLRAE
jgi:hypothetical protein